MTFEEWSKKKKEEEEQAQVSNNNSGGTSISFEEWSNQQIAKSIDQSYIDSFVSDVNRYFNLAQTEYESMKVGNASVVHHRMDSRYQGMTSKANKIRRWLNANKDSIDAETFSNLTGYLDSIEKDAPTLLKNFEGARDFYSQFHSESEYDAWKVSNDKYQANLNYDLEGAMGEISSLESSIEEINAIRGRQENYYNFLAENNITHVDDVESAKSMYGLANPGYDIDSDSELLKEILARHDYTDLYTHKNGFIGPLGGYTDEDKIAYLEEQIASKKAAYDEAKKVQDQYALISVGEIDSKHYDQNFDIYVQRGKAVENPILQDTSDMLWYDGSGINNIVQFAEDNAAYVMTKSLQALQSGSSPEFVQTAALILTQATEEEKATYNYYIGKGDAENAQKYLDIMLANCESRQAGDIADQLGESNGFTQAIFYAVAGLDSFVQGIGNLDNLFMGTEADSSSVLQQAVSIDRLRNDGDVGIVNDIAYSVGNMLPSMVAGYFTFGAAGALTMGASASGNAYSEMVNAGYTPEQAQSYAVLVGASEAGLQYLLGGISKLGGKVSGKALTNLTSKFDNALVKVAVKYGGSMASEGLEEAIQTILEPAFKALATGEDFEAAEWEDVWYSALLGALTSGVLEGGPAIVGGTYSNIKSNIDAKKTFGGMQSDLVAEGIEIGGDAQTLAEKYKTKLDKGKNLSGRQLKNLVNTNEQTMLASDTAKIKSATEARLTELGEKGDVGKLADALVKQASGKELSKAEIALINNSTYGERVANELSPDNIESGLYSSAWAEKIDTDRINPSAYSRGLDTTPVAESADATKVAIKTESDLKVSDSGKTTIVTEKASEEGETSVARTEIANYEIASIKDGEIMLRLEDGETVSINDVELGSNDEVLLYENAIDMGLNAATANAFVRGYDPSEGLSVEEYILGFREAYRYGEYGFPVQEMSADGFSANLNEAKRSLAYGLGKTDAKYKISSKQDSIAKAKESSASKGKKGKLHNTLEPTNERQRASLKALGVIAEALGVDIYTFESDVDAYGKRKGANGWYNPKDGSIHIDLYAGKNGESTMLFTAAHELTHFIREWSPVKFKVFADFLLEQYGKEGVSVSDLVSEQIEKAKNNGRDISYDEAYEEVIADACETMLTDSNAIEVIAKLKAKDKGLWQRIKDFINKLVARITSAYAGMSPDSVEAGHVRTMLESAEKLQALWTEALVDASVSYASAEKNLIENGIAVDSKTESASLMSVRDVLNDEQRQKVSSALATRFGVTQTEAMGWLNAETSLASLILNPKYSQYLDYTADANEEAIKSNSDYPQGTVDFSNICKKRRDFTEVMNRVLRNFPNHVFEATDLAKIRTIMMEEGMEVACGICYVEDRRQLDSIVAQDFIDSLALYRKGSKTRPDGKAFNTNQLKALKRIDGDSYTPSIYELISLEGRNILKSKNPAMEEAWVKFNNARGMSSVRLLLNDAEYKRQILSYKPSTVKRKNDLGGLRIYSFSDAEMFHLIDIIQVITDSATVGLSLQGYTKVNEYARAVKDTGEKLNRSLIPKGDLGYHIEDGKVVLDYDAVEGIDINHPDFFDNIDNPNVGNILIGINPTQIRAAMTSKFVDQIIPFHTGQSNEVLGEKGIATWVNYKDAQSERDVGTGKKSTHQINIYTEVIQAAEADGHPITNKVEFVNKFLEVCKENNLIPRFSDFLNVDENGDYVYTEGYHKFLVDFKTFDQNTGEYLPQMPVKPIFDNEYITRLLKDYVKSQKAKDAELAKAMPKVLDRITKEIVNADSVKFSGRDSWSNIESIQGLENYSVDEIIDITKNHIESILEEYGEYAEIVAVRPYGSRAKGTAKSGSDLDIVVQYEGDIREDDMFNMLNDEDGKLYIDGIEVDINPIKADDSGTVEEYFNRVYDFDKYSTKYSDRDSYAPTFYSHMGKVIDGIRLDKMGASGVVSYLKGKGVKAEEIKWSGIETFLEGKKSVSKAELQEFVAGSQLQIKEEMSNPETYEVISEGKDYIVKDKSTGYVLSTWKHGESFGQECWTDEDGNIAFSATDIAIFAEEEGYGDSSTRWSQYRLDGGSNYRELVFKMPNSTYSNNAMRVHWGQDAEGVLAHARIQDITTADGKRMLFIEEIQSDWHNEGRQKGYTTKEYEDAVAVYDKLAEDYANKRRAFNKYVRSSEFRSDPDEVSKKKFDWLRSKMDTAEKRMHDAERDIDSLKKKGMGDVPDAPFRNNYHEYVLKRLLRMAAEEGYDSIGWTPSDIQADRWSYDYEKAYKIEYDQDIPSFLKKYGKKWGAKVGTAKTTESYDVWSMDIPDSMKDSVLNEGQVMYSLRGTNKDGIEVYETSEETKKLPYKERQKVFLDIMTNQYRGRTAKFVRNGHAYYATFEEADVNKNIYGDTKSDTKGWKAKINVGADGDIFELVENAQYDGSKPEKGKKIASHRGVGYWDYFIKTVQIDNVVFDLLANVRKKSEGNYVYNIQLKANKKIEASPSLGLLLKASNRMLNASGNSIAEDAESVKRKFSDRNSATFKGKSFWSGSVSLLDGVIEEVHTMEEAEAVDFHHSMYFSQAQVEKMENGENAFFWVDKGVVNGNWRENMPQSIIDRIKEQITIDPKYSDRNPDSASNRSLLANALESVAENDIERSKLKQYKEKISLIESEQKKLSEIRAKIKEASFAKGVRDTEAIKSLQFEANQIANRINTYDKQLLSLESTKALKGVLEREKAMLRKRLEQKGKEALASYKEKAAKTQRELLTRAQESRKKGIESRHKTEMRHKIKNVVSDLNKLLLNPTKEQHVPIGLQKVVAEALDAINMDTMNAEERVAYYNDLISKSTDPDEIAMLARKRDFFEYRDANFKDRITALKNAYAEFTESDDPLIRNAHNDAIEDLIKNTADMVGNKSLKDMSLEQLEAVYDMYKAILSTVRNSNKMFKEARQTTITENSEAVKTEVKEVGGHKTRVRKLTKGINAFGWNTLKPIYAFDRIGSDTLTMLYENVRAGEDTYATDVAEATAFFDDKAQKYKFDSWDFKKRYTFEDSIGTEFSLSLEQIMSLYAYSKREQADKHLEFGGFVFDDAITVTEKGKFKIPVKYEVNDANPYRLRKEDLATVISTLSEDQKAFIDEMQTYLSDVMGAKGNEITLAMYDIKLFKEKNYFPLKTSRYFREYNPEQSGNPMLRNSGFTKKTVPKAGNPIVLSNFMDVWTGHVNDMSMYHSFVLPLEDFMRVYNYSSTAGGYDSVQQYIKNAYGANANQYIEKLMQDINGGVASVTLNNPILKMFSKFKKVTVAASLSTVVQQPTAIIRAMAEINPKHFVGVPFKGGHKKTWNEIKQYAPIAIIKEMGGIDVGSGRQAMEYITSRRKGLIGKIDDGFMWMATKADELGWNAIWKAVKREVASTQKLKPGTEEFFKACGKRFTEVVTRTQVYDSVFSRSGFMRDKGDLNKFATSFMGEPTTSFNMIVGAVLNILRGGSKVKSARTIGSVYASIVAAAAMASLIYALRDDDEDESYLEKYAEAFGNKLSSEIWIHNMIPYVRDIASILEGWDVERPDMSIISDLKSSFDKLFTTNEDGELEWNVDFSDFDSVYSAIENFCGSIAALFGIPLKNIMRDTRGIINGIEAIFDDIKPSGVGDAFVRGWTGEDQTKGEKLYDAIINGDEARIKELKKGYKTESSYESAVRSALRKNDPRINEAAQARIDGDIAEYTRIAKEIIREGHFTQDTVVAAINAEINALKKGEETTTSSSSSNKVTSIYKVDDYYSAIASGDMSTANAVKEDMIRTEVANGKDRDEAESNFNSRFASYCRELYEEGLLSDYDAIRMLVNYGGKSEDDAASKVQYWEFKKQYPDYDDLSEEAVDKYYTEVEPWGINISVYYDYVKGRAKCKGTDNDNDGRTDSGSVKAEVMAVIDSLPITSQQKDALYYLNGWSQSTIYQAPWR